MSTVMNVRTVFPKVGNIAPLGGNKAIQGELKLQA